MHIGRRPFTSPVVSVVFYCALFLRVLGAVIGIVTFLVLLLF